MNIRMNGLVWAVGVAGLLAVAGCDDKAGSGVSNSFGGVPPPPPVIAEACKTDALSFGQVGVEPGAGQRVATYAFTNTGSAPCSLTGFPFVIVTDAGGSRQSPIKTTHDDGSPKPVALKPGGKAEFTLTYSGISGAGFACTKSGGLTVNIPGDSKFDFHDKTALQICDDRVRLSPIHAPKA